MSDIPIEHIEKLIEHFLDSTSSYTENVLIDADQLPYLSQKLDIFTNELLSLEKTPSELLFLLFKKGEVHSARVEKLLRNVRTILARGTIGRSEKLLVQLVSSINQQLFSAFGSIAIAISSQYELQVVEMIVANIESEKAAGEITIGSFLAMQLFVTPSENCFNIPLEKISEPFTALFLTYRLPKQAIYIDFWENGKSANYLEQTMNEAQLLLRNISWIKSNLYKASDLIHHIFSCTTFIPAYFIDKPLKTLFSIRGEIYGQAMDLLGYSLDYTFSVSNRPRKRIGFLSYHFNPQTETYVTLPAFKYLDRSRYEIILYTCRVSGIDSLEQECFSYADRVVKLPSELLDQVSVVRADDLDFLIFGTNITVHSEFPCKLAMFRLARHTAVTSCCPVTTGFSHIDYYISGSYTEPKINEEYCEERLLIDGPAHSFDYGEKEEQILQQAVASIGVEKGKSLVVFGSGANYFKLNRDLITSWVTILRNVPGSVLILYPFNPNWSQRYPQRYLDESIAEVCRVHGVDRERIKIIAPLPHRSAILQVLSKCDIYLDSFPYSGATSLIDPLLVGIPVVALAGKTARCRQSYAIMKSLDLAQLCPSSEEEYTDLAIRLAQDRSLRESISEKIRTGIAAEPSFRNSYRFSKEMERLFDEILYT